MRTFASLLTAALVITASLPALAQTEPAPPRLASACQGIPAHKIARPVACQTPSAPSLQLWLDGVIKAWHNSQPQHKTAVQHPAGSRVPSNTAPAVSAYPAHKTANP